MIRRPTISTLFPCPPLFGYRKWRVGGGSCPQGIEENFSSLPPTLGSGLPCLSTSNTTPQPLTPRTPPCLTSSSAWAKFENASALTQGRDSALTHSDGHPNVK